MPRLRKKSQQRKQLVTRRLAGRWVKPRLTYDLILAWADAHRRRTSGWPSAHCGRVSDNRAESWLAIDLALQRGMRGLPGGIGLADLLRERRGHRHLGKLPPLRRGQILAWADAHYERTGRWPSSKSGPVPEAPGETWAAVGHALADGGRGLPGGESVSGLLANHRAVRPQLTVQRILAWADSHQQRTGQWPGAHSGAVIIASGESWAALDAALTNGRRGLPRGASLADILHRHRGVRNRGDLPPLSTDRILAWADAYHEQTGRWPYAESGEIPRSGGETWMRVDIALRDGHRGLPGDSSLAQSLHKRRGVRNPSRLPRLSNTKILAWADAHRRKSGTWPKRTSGVIHEAPGEKWSHVDAALTQGRRGLPGTSSLAQLLSRRRGVRNHLDLPRLSVQAILAWADDHHARMGSWPTTSSGAVAAAPEENWRALDAALREGLRGLRHGASLSKLLAQHRGVRNPAKLPKLSTTVIIRWARRHHKRTGHWPTPKSGPISDAPDETWSRVDSALSGGRRGLPGGDSLLRLLARQEHHGRRDVRR